MVSCDRVEWALALGFQHQSEVHQFLAKLLISLTMSRSCSDYQPIKERKYDDFHQSKANEESQFLLIKFVC